MRQQAKPFTVEIKKSRKATSEPQPLFGFLEEAAARAPQAPAARLFERPQENGRNGHDGGQNGANGHAEVEADIARVFGAAAVQRPANRILPDLTAKPAVPAVEDEAPRERRPRVAKIEGAAHPEAEAAAGHAGRTGRARAGGRRRAGTGRPCPPPSEGRGRAQRAPSAGSAACRASRARRSIPARLAAAHDQWAGQGS